MIAGVEIDGVLGFVGQMGATVLQLGDLASGSVLLIHSCVREPLAWRSRSRRMRSSAFGVATPLSCAICVQHLAIALAVVAAHDGAQRRIGLHRRAIDADPLAFDQTLLGNELQHPAEDCLEHLVRQTSARLRQPRVIGYLSRFDSRRKARSDSESEQRQTIPRSLAIPSK